MLVTIGAKLGLQVLEYNPCVEGVTDHISIKVLTDGYPGETSWKLMDVSNGTMPWFVRVHKDRTDLLILGTLMRVVSQMVGTPLRLRTG